MADPQVVHPLVKTLGPTPCPAPQVIHPLVQHTMLQHGMLPLQRLGLLHLPSLLQVSQGPGPSWSSFQLQPTLIWVDRV